MYHTTTNPQIFAQIKPPDSRKFAARSGHRIVVDEKYIYSWGGFNPEFWEYASNSEDTRYPLFRELWRYEFLTDQWKKLEITGEAPEGLASAAVIKVNHHLLHHGGSGVPFGEQNCNAIYDLDLRTLKWKRLVPPVEEWEKEGAPKPKYGQSLTAVGDYLYIVGGTSGYTYDMEVNRLHLGSLTWEHLPAQSKYAPEERYRHETIHYQGKLYVIGGGRALVSCVLDFVDVFDIETRHWQKIDTYKHQHRNFQISPRPRKCHSCHLLKDDVYVIGGLFMEVVQSVIWKLNLPSMQWTRLDLRLPQPVYFHSSALTKEGCLLIHGGVTKYDSERTNSLQVVWLTVAPLQRMALSVIWKCLDLTKIHTNYHKLVTLGVPSHMLAVSG